MVTLPQFLSPCRLTACLIGQAGRLRGASVGGAGGNGRTSCALVLGSLPLPLFPFSPSRPPFPQGKGGSARPIGLRCGETGAAAFGSRFCCGCRSPQEPKKIRPTTVYRRSPSVSKCKKRNKTPYFVAFFEDQKIKAIARNKISVLFRFCQIKVTLGCLLDLEPAHLLCCYCTQVYKFCQGFLRNFLYFCSSKRSAIA